MLALGRWAGLGAELLLFATPFALVYPSALPLRELEVRCASIVPCEQTSPFHDSWPLSQLTALAPSATLLLYL